ncbi:MAG: hypothetical protein ACEPOZ_03820 [Marinifilaceae bacterium]
MEAITYPFHFDEMPIAGKFLLDSYVRDQELFLKKYPVFDDVFKSKFIKKINRCRELICCCAEGQKIQIIRDRIYRKMESLRVLTMDLKECFPYTAPEAFEKLTIANDSKDLLEVLETGKNLYLKIEIPKKILQADDNFSSLLDEFHALLEILELDRLELNRLLNSRGILTQDIFRNLNHLWATMQDIMEIGKEIHEDIRPNFYSDYCIEHLKQRLRLFRVPVADLSAV